MRENETNNEANKQIEIGNTSFYVTSNYTGKIELQDLIKRLIQKDIEATSND